MTSGRGGTTSGVESEEHGEVILTPVAGGLTFQNLISTFALSTGCSTTWVMELGPEQSWGRFMKRYLLE